MAKVQVFAYEDDISQTSDQALRNLSNKSLDLGITQDSSALYEALVNREQQGSTALVSGVCLPHAKSSAVLNPSVIAVRFSRPITWSDADDVQVALCLLMPEGKEGMKHLKNLSKIAAFLSNEDNTELLLNESDVNVIRDMVATVIETEGTH